MHLYVVAGLAVASELPLVGLIDAERGSTTAGAVRIRLAPTPDSLPGPCRAGPNWAMNETQLLLTIPGVVRALLTEGRDVAVELAPGRSPGDVAIFITETMLGIVMQQRRRFVLRASAVVLRDRAILFCGPPGSGKSTLAAALDDAGYPFLGDDLCVIEPGASSVPAAHTGDGTLKLWADAIEALRLETRRDAAVRPDVEKYHLRPRYGQPGGALPVAAIYHLREAKRGAGAAVEALAGLAAVRMVGDSAYHPLLAAAGSSALYFERAAELVRTARAFAFTRRLDFAGLDESIAALEGHWSASGLLESER